MKIKPLVSIITKAIIEFLDDVRSTWKAIVLSFLGMAMIIMAMFNLMLPAQQAYYRYKARTESERYGKCLICHDHYPHKKLKDYGGYKWVCNTEGETNNCEGLYTRKQIIERIK